MIRFTDGVKEGRQIVIAIRRRETENEKDQWRLGEIAADLEPKYGEQTLEKFGEAVELDVRTIQMYRQTFLAWKKEKRGRPRFSVGKELNKHPHKSKVIKLYPKMTQRKAREVMRKHKRATKQLPALNMNNVANQLCHWLQITFKQQRYVDLSKAIIKYQAEIDAAPRRALINELRAKINLLQTLQHRLEEKKDEKASIVAKRSNQVLLP
jgi:hypothetical protein